MKPIAAEAVVETHLSIMHEVLAEAASSSAAAMACLNAGNHRRAFEIALDIEPLLSETDNLLQACSILRRRLASSSE
jgi:hypothetical protein